MIYNNEHWLDIINRALVMINSSMLQSLTEEGINSSICTEMLPQAVEEVYSVLPLDDISIYKTLNETECMEKGLFTHAFPIPTNSSRIREVLTGEFSYQITRDYILSFSSECTIRYIPLPDDPWNMPLYLRSIISLKLASRLGLSIAHNETLSNLFNSQYENAVSKYLTLKEDTREQNGYISSASYIEERE